MALKERYRAHIQSHGFSEDPSQLKAIEALQRLATALEQHTTRTLNVAVWPAYSWTALNVSQSKEYISGAALGGVRPLSWIYFSTRLLYRANDANTFHRFMNAVHSELKQLEQQSDPLETVAATIASEVQVICFDEFFVSDIADAMVLGNLSKRYFVEGSAW